MEKKNEKDAQDLSHMQKKTVKPNRTLNTLADYANDKNFKEAAEAILKLQKQARKYGF